MPARKSVRPVTAISGKAKILVVDDHAIVREGLVRVIGATPDMKVCAQAANLFQALEVIPKTKPMLAIIDISLGHESGIDLIKKIKAFHPDLLMLVHSMYDETIYAERCLRAGAKGYVMKQEAAEKLLLGMRCVLRGGTFLSEAVTNQLIGRISGSADSKGSSPAELLSDRELEVFELLGRGHRTKEIAGQLHLSDKTIQTYREHIKKKLGLSDAVDLVRRAVQWVEARR